MSRETSENLGHMPRREGDGWQGYRPPAGWSGSSGSSAGLLLAGLAVAGVIGALAWYVLGPDIKRYMKIRDM